MSEQTLMIELPPGPLGVTIQRRDDFASWRPTASPADGDGGRNVAPPADDTGPGGQCVVTSRNDPNSSLEPNDVILSLNGIKLSDVNGGMNAWVTLFGAFSDRRVVVLRGGPTTTTTTTTTIATDDADAAARCHATRQQDSRGHVLASCGNPSNPLFESTTKTKGEMERARAAPGYAPSSERRQQQQQTTTTTAAAEISAVRGSLGSLPLSFGDAAAAGAIGGDGGGAGAGAVATTKKRKYNKSAKQMAKEAGDKKTKEGAGKMRSPPPPPPMSSTGRYKKTKGASTNVVGSGVATYYSTWGNKICSGDAWKRDDGFTHDDNYMKLLADGFPDPGRVSSCLTYYVANNGDCLPKIAEKIGLSSWKLLNDVEFNRRFYGVLTRLMTLKRDTVIKIPTSLCSKWKLSKLVDRKIEQIMTMATCSKCSREERPDDTDEMLMCDGCDLAMHVSCAGLSMVPNGDWLCGACLDILDARKKSHATDKEGDRRSIVAKLPPLSTLDNETARMVTKAKMKFREEMLSRKSAALSRLEENEEVLAVASKARVSELEDEVREADARVAALDRMHKSALNVTLANHGLKGWSIKNNSSHITYRLNDGTSKSVYKKVFYQHGRMKETKCPEWDAYYRKVKACSRELKTLSEIRAYDSAKSRSDSLKMELKEARDECNDRGIHYENDRKTLLLNFAKLLSEPRLDFETASHHHSRAGHNPMFLGVVKIEELDLRVLNILKEPTELAIPIPTDSTITIDNDDDNEALQTETEYYLFGTSELFCPERNDCTPMDFSPTSTRTAQRDLMCMLRRDTRNSAFEVSQPVIPSSVVVRGTTDETLGDIVKCFDLSELVRDCHYPIQDQPLAETPKRLSENGLVLRDYQKASLQWLIDKECNPTGLGSRGELWARMRGLEVDDGYFYCDLTGSIVKDIFNYNSDVVQSDASKLGGDTFPSSAILGSEMGLGKTVMALSLVVANPPRLENRVLPREYVANIDHPAYLLTPSVAGIVSSYSSRTYLSNATLVVAPMTLCPQWASEIARFAPWMSFVTLHNDELESAAEIASKDMVIVSTFIMSQPTGKQGAIMNKLRSIHFHRIFLDESHYNNTGERVKLSLAQLSSTHRHCVTGTPVGHSLADLYGQLRFLRVPEFCRPDFWEQNVSSPYSDRNCYALNVLRSLLSRMVIRHSKEQTLNNGEALVSLPPRHVETLLIPFGSEAERKIYEYIELRNTQRFTELRADSPASVLSKFMDLQGMMSSARMACAHSSLVNLDALHDLNERLEYERRQKKENLLRAQLGKKMWEEEKKKKTKSPTRADVFHEAVAKALPSAQARMRDIVLLFHDGEMEHAECPVCLEAIVEKDIALTPCAHMFCAECILSCLHTLSSTREPTGKCPKCREAIKKSELTFLGHAKDAGKPPTEDQKPEAKKVSTGSTVDINGFSFSTKDTVAAASSGAGDRRISYQPLTDLEKRQQRVICHTLPPEFLTAWNDGYNAIGTKVARLLEEIKSMSRKDPTAKAVVFSQYLGTLDVAGQEMTARGINFARVDGTMQQHQRADAVQSFINDQRTVVLLLSMRAGAAGLNLMIANHCFLMDPAMNSAVEEQAIDRIHRIGQTRPVFVKRFIIKDSIEKRILETRRSLAADCPRTSTHLDGTSLLDVNDSDKGRTQRVRLEDEGDMGEQRFQRLHQLESLFGCSTKVKTDVSF